VNPSAQPGQDTAPAEVTLQQVANPRRTKVDADGRPTPTAPENGSSED
jgi:hypothetical protein